MPKFEGIEFDFGGGRVYTIPPIAPRDLQKMRPQVKTMQATIQSNPLACVGVCIDVVHVALIRNYPELSRSDVAALITVANAHQAVLCALDVDGSRGKALKAAAGRPGGPRR